MSLQDLLGNVVAGPWNAQAGQASQDYNAYASQYGSLQQWYATQQAAPYPMPTPEESRQYEIMTKNRRNYAHWLARIARDPLTDCEARP